MISLDLPATAMSDRYSRIEAQVANTNQRNYCETLERFLRELGINESNAHECELHSSNADDLSVTIFRRGEPVWRMTARRRGFFFGFECQPIAENHP